MFTFGAQTNCIVLSDAGITRIDEHGDVTTVLFESCAGLVKASGGSRLVLGDDRQTLAIAPKTGVTGQSLSDCWTPQSRTIAPAGRRASAERRTIAKRRSFRARPNRHRRFRPMPSASWSCRCPETKAFDLLLYRSWSSSFSSYVVRGLEGEREGSPLP